MDLCTGLCARSAQLLQRTPPGDSADLLDRRWVADVSEFSNWDRKFYLASIRDLHDHTLTRQLVDG